MLFYGCCCCCCSCCCCCCTYIKCWRANIKPTVCEFHVRVWCVSVSVCVLHIHSVYCVHQHTQTQHQIYTYIYTPNKYINVIWRGCFFACFSSRYNARTSLVTNGEHRNGVVERSKRALRLVARVHLTFLSVKRVCDLPASMFSNRRPQQSVLIYIRIQYARYGAFCGWRRIAKQQHSDAIHHPTEIERHVVQCSTIKCAQKSKPPGPVNVLSKMRDLCSIYLDSIVDAMDLHGYFIKNCFISQWA